mmetsp:Transcript_34019/g.66446  ORF Transcript_34019/g.66446 Transcript_34019/m.66446 type:complete len:381 (-) Transcript_34019:68-1210(-)
MRVRQLAHALIHRAPAGYALLCALHHLRNPLLDVVFARAILNDNDAVTLTLNHLGDVIKHDSGLKRHRLEQTHISRPRRKHRVQAHAARPKLADPDAILHAARCKKHLVDRLDSPLHDGVEADALVDEGEVVLDTLRGGDDRQLHLAGDGAHLDRVRIAAGLHIAEEKEHVDPPLLEHLQHLLDVALVGRVPQDRPPLLVDVKHRLLRELQPVLGRLIAEPSPPEPHPPRPLDVVAVMQRVGDLPYDYIDAGVEPAAGHNRRVHLGGSKVSLLAGPSSNPFVVDQALALRAHGLEEDGVGDGLVVAYKVCVDGPGPCYHGVLVLLEVREVAFEPRDLVGHEVLGDGGELPSVPAPLPSRRNSLRHSSISRRPSLQPQQRG